MAMCSLRINMTGAGNDPETCSARYRAALDMASYADKNGFDFVNLEEHHCADNGWLPSPLTMAAAVAARTESVGVGIMALLASLYDPVRLAEDLAVIDHISRGRLTFVAGLGYRDIEFHAMDKPFEGRGAWFDHVLDTLLKAWTLDSFDYRGRTISVTPKPYTRPHPFMMVGGMSRPAARRAAKLGLPFSPPAYDAQLESYYLQCCSEFGTAGFFAAVPAGFTLFLVHEDPEQGWRQWGDCILNEVREYAAWAQPGLQRPLEMAAASVDALRADGRYEILTPQDCIARHQQEADTQFVLHPLVGGVPLDEAWYSLELFAEKVLPEIRPAV